LFCAGRYLPIVNVIATYHLLKCSEFDILLKRCVTADKGLAATDITMSSGGRPRRGTRKSKPSPSPANSRPEGLPKSPPSNRKVPALVSRSSRSDDRSVGTQGSSNSAFTATSAASRPGLDPFLLKALLQKIESEEYGGLPAIKKLPSKTHVLEQILDSRIAIDGGELFGQRGDKIRTHIGQYFDRWKRYSNEEYIVKVLDKYQVQSFKNQKSAKKASKNQVAQSEGGVSDLDDEEFEVIPESNRDEFLIKEVVTTRKKKIAAKPTAPTKQLSPPSRSPPRRIMSHELSPGGRAMAERFGKFFQFQL